MIMINVHPFFPPQSCTLAAVVSRANTPFQATLEQTFPFSVLAQLFVNQTGFRVQSNVDFLLLSIHPGINSICSIFISGAN